LFQGSLDLGLIPAGAPMTVSYRLYAYAFGVGAANMGIAAINDPFLVSTDPVQRFDTLSLTLTNVDSVPEPDSRLLALAGSALLLGIRLVRAAAARL